MLFRSRPGPDSSSPSKNITILDSLPPAYESELNENTGTDDRNTALSSHDFATMNVTRTVARAALRLGGHSRPAAAATATASSRLAACYHSYPLPSRPTTTPPRNDDIPESSIAKPTEPLPKVHETRPPPDQKAAAPPPPAPPSAAAGAAAPQSQQQQQQQQQKQPIISEGEAQKPKPRARPRPKLRARKAAMTLTPAAVEQLRGLLDQPDPKLIKVGVRNRGCSGLAYNLEYVDKEGPFDEMVEQDGVKVVIDSKALFSIIGTEMDWAEDKLNQRFVFKNPNIKEECGCGESFMV